MSKELTTRTNQSLNPHWKAKQDAALSLSKSIIDGKAQLALIEMNLSINDTFSKPILRSTFTGNLSSVGFGVVKVLVSRFIDAFAFTTKLNQDQIETLTVDTLENFAYESLEDVILFFKMARSGKFGVAKKSIDANLIFGEWFPQYLETKADLREQNIMEEKNRMNSRDVSIDDVKATYAAINKKTLFKQAQAHIDHITKTMDRQMLEDTILTWSKDPKLRPYLNLLKLKRKTIK